MLCSSVIKEQLYIGEATVATICGIIFGPLAANLIDPISWGSNDIVTYEFTRIILVVQCFAVGVELPRAYMERHWKSVTLLLVPVMAFGWLATSLCIWWMVPRLDWLDSLCCAACVTATDPVLASSVVGKGKFAKRVPRHLRDLLSAESGCNDGMAFPFVYFGIYMIRYRPDANQFSLYWFCVAILYQCVFGAIYGVIIGYIARRAIRFAHEKALIDRESFLVFYFVLALFCAGSGSVLGLDDLLVGFACGVGFSNDGWFQEKTEESAVSNVIDLLLNLTFFVYFGTIIPWDQFNSPSIGTTPWRLVVLAILVLIFRRIPIMLALKPFIPDIKSWREASFAGHFGPIGVGAIFVAILVRAEFETGTSTPLPELPPPGSPNMNIIELVWPVTTFLVLCSIVVHGSSVAVFTLGKRINTLTLTLSYTQANEEGPSWMERLPRIQSRSKSSMSLRRPEDYDYSKEEKELDNSNILSPLGGLAPHNIFRRQKEDDISKPWSVHQRRRRIGKRSAGGPISPSAIGPVGRTDPDENEKSYQSSINELDTSAPTIVISGPEQDYNTTTLELERNVYQEGSRTTVIEDGDGNVLDVQRDGHSINDDTSRRSSLCDRVVEKIRSRDSSRVRIQPADDSQTDSKDSEEMDKKVENVTEAPLPVTNIDQNFNADDNSRWKYLKRTISDFGDAVRQARQNREPRNQGEKPLGGTAHAYQFGNTIIVEDEDGEVIKKYDMPSTKRPEADRTTSTAELSRVTTRQRLQRMGTYLGVPPPSEQESEADGAPAEPGSSNIRDESTERQADSVAATSTNDGNNDDNLRFTMGTSGRRMSKAEFINEVMKLDSKDRTNSAGDGGSAGTDITANAAAPKISRNRPSFFKIRRNTEKRAAGNIGENSLAPMSSNPTNSGSVHRARQTTTTNVIGSDLSHVPTYEEDELEAMGTEDVLSLLPSHMGKDVPSRSPGGTAEATQASQKEFSPSSGRETAAKRQRRLSEEDSQVAARRRAEARTSSTTSASVRTTSPQERPGRGTGKLPPTSSSSSSKDRVGAPMSLRRGDSNDDDAAAAAAAAAAITDSDDEAETAAERRRREGALGLSIEPDTDTDTESESDNVAARRSSAVKRKEKSKRDGITGKSVAASASTRATASDDVSKGVRTNEAPDTKEGKNMRFVEQQQPRQHEKGDEQRHSSPSPPPPPTTTTTTTTTIRSPPLARLRWGSDVGKRRQQR